LHQLDAILPSVRQLGERHRGYGVSADHYGPVGAALLWTLEEGLGSAFTPEVKAAWSEAYRTLAGAMQEGERHARATAEAMSPVEKSGSNEGRRPPLTAGGIPPLFLEQCLPARPISDFFDSIAPTLTRPFPP